MTGADRPLDDFERLLAADDERSEPDNRPRSWMWIPMVCIALGATVCASVIIASLVSSNAPPPVTATTPVSTAVPEGVVDESDALQEPAVQRISDRPDEEWVTSLAARTAIPERALRAYAGAAIVAAEESPECGLGWNTLAGIGLVESEHGTIHGSHIGEDGVARPGIIGIPLTGESSLAIRDTDDGLLDGDSEWDRAVGPMQFIPTTWNEWGADGDGDGIRDPQNIDDSALAAARYLCFAGGDLTKPENWIAAIHAYNPSVEYNNRVADAAQHYGATSTSF